MEQQFHSRTAILEYLLRTRWLSDSRFESMHAESFHLDSLCREINDVQHVRKPRRRREQNQTNVCEFCTSWTPFWVSRVSVLRMTACNNYQAIENLLGRKAFKISHGLPSRFTFWLRRSHECCRSHKYSCRTGSFIAPSMYCQMLNRVVVLVGVCHFMTLVQSSDSKL